MGSIHFKKMAALLHFLAHINKFLAPCLNTEGTFFVPCVIICYTHLRLFLALESAVWLQKKVDAKKGRKQICIRGDTVTQEDMAVC